MSASDDNKQHQSPVIVDDPSVSPLSLALAQSRSSRSFKYDDDIYCDANGKPGVPLADVIFSCIDKWSLYFLRMSENGDPDYMLAVAEAYLRRGGYGKLEYDQKKGERWLRKAECHSIPGATRFKALVAARKKQLGDGVPVWFEPFDDSDLGPAQFALLEEKAKTATETPSKSKNTETSMKADTHEIPDTTNPSPAELAALLRKLNFNS